ncbi:MAG: sigma-70 family RNA polymerase sigma factor [Patescibacteria group bacterium]|nr:sigma-70 family RNA polymerase sigma factor [Patescibacteria group bacterium]
MTNTHKKFNEVHEEYVDRIFRFILLKVSSNDVAQDLCSDVFTRLLREIEYKTDIKNYQAFLYKIANNIVIDYYRKKSKTETIALDNEQNIEDTSFDTARQATVNSDMNGVMRAMTNLKQDYQNVVIWHYIDELSVSEISEMTNKTQGAIRVMLHRGIKELKRHLS